MMYGGAVFASRFPVCRAVPLFFLLAVLCMGGCAGFTPFGGNAAPIATGPLPPATKRAAAVIATARSALGRPYAWGGETPTQGFDCSGLVWWAFAKNGVRMPRVSWQQYGAGRFVDKRDIRPGDLVFYRVQTGKSLHVGIVTRRRTFIHSPRSGKHVMESDMNNPFWSEHYVGARRILP